MERERESKGPRDLEAYCSGGQGPPRAVAPTDDDDCTAVLLCSFEYEIKVMNATGVYGRIILNWIIKKNKMVWRGLISSASGCGTLGIHFPVS